ncbi:hypothetical protein MBANPS3_012106 [Mucor bainieri]
MELPQKFQDYKIPVIGNGSQRFFSSTPAQDWNFTNYFSTTHENINNKFKKYGAIKKSFKDDLDWVSKMENLPKEIKEFVDILREQELPKKPTMKCRISKKALQHKKGSLVHQGITIKGNVEGHIITNSNNVVIESTTTDMLRKRKHGDDESEKSESDDDQDEDEGDSEADSIWREWLRFLKQRKGDFHPYSPASHKIVRCGKGVSPRPYLDRKLYNRHLATFTSETHALPANCVPYMDKVIDSEDLESFKKALKSTRDDYTENEKTYDFLEDIFRGALEGYSTFQDVHDGESTFDALFIYPYLRAVSKAVTSHSCGADFKRGEANLIAMSKQLIALGLKVDDKSQYKADGLIKLYQIKQLEILLLETSGSLGSTEKVKINFDHHKGVFGSLAMLKTIADEFSLASADLFQQLKVYFVHAAGNEIHLWSVRFRKGDCYELWREDHLEIKTCFEDKVGFLPALIQFYWNMKGLLENSVDSLVALREDHLRHQVESRYSAPSSTLSNIVNPSILRLIQEEDSAGMSNLGPFYSPPHD